MRFGLGIVLVVVVAALFWWQTPVPGGTPHPPGGNRLAGEASPYLQLHADNPVDWYPWGPEALDRARTESKPIFLSIGYSTCYWCHVMERLVFSNPEIAASMNQDFVNIKVDREERPDLDEIYMTATLLLRGSGGWPNSLFLTPEGQPFFAGTYFPPEDGRGRPGFPSVLERMAQLWRDDRPRVRSVAANLTRAIRERSEARPAAPASFDPAVLVSNAVDELARAHDDVRGGFSTRPKFPNPPKLELLLVASEHGDEAALAMLTRTLDAMALGGIYDHLAGGFHRYATDATWSVPHFEKMLYDNAQLLGLYARAWSVTRRPLYRRVVEELLVYLDREMTHKDGGFYSAQDAQVEDEEGASYVWERGEIEDALGADGARAFLATYRLAPMPEGPGGVLRLPFPASAGQADEVAALASARATLLERRNRRAQPLRDEKILAAWNGLAIRGLVQAASALGRRDVQERAERAARFVLTHHRRAEGGLHRSWIAGQARERAVLDDYAFLADGLLALHRATGDPEWLARARELAERMLDDHEDAERGGFYLTAADSNLLVRPRPLEDGAEPAGNGVALRVVRRLAELTGEDRFQRAAERAAAAHSAFFERTPSVASTAVAALAALPPGIVEGREPVQVSARLDSPRRVVVRVALDPGWHVNANPASLPSLIPTSVAVESGGTVGTIRYPEGVRFEPEFVPEALSVYEGAIEIPVELASRDEGPLELAVRYQACDLKICLAPKTQRLSLDR